MPLQSNSEVAIESIAPPAAALQVYNQWSPISEQATRAALGGVLA